MVLTRIIDRSSTREKVLAEESGFTLVETMVAMLILTIVLFGLYGIFGMSLRVATTASDKIEATQTARFALERIEREVRMAYPGNALQSVPATYRKNLLCAPSASGSTSAYCAISSDATRLAFGNDLNGNGWILKCDNISTCDATYDLNELIVYYLCDVDNDGSVDVVRNSTQVCNVGSTTPGVPSLIELGNGGSLNFTYLQEDKALADGGDADLDPDPISPPFTASGTAPTEAKIIAVRIQMNVRVDRGPGAGTLQKLTTDVTLRNRNR